jgi:hypothetical protein
MMSRPPGTDSYDFHATATFSWTWTAPTGQWVPGLTRGVPLGNATTDLQFVMPTTTLTSGQGPNPTPYFANCPVTNEDRDNGFDWEFVPTECWELLDPYCNPALTGTPLPSTTFPAECMPSNFILPEGSGSD